jgi:phosphonate transport system substrate-binding protein
LCPPRLGNPRRRIWRLRPRAANPEEERLKRIRTLFAALLALGCFGVGGSIGTAGAVEVLNVGLVPAEDPRMIVNDNKALLDALRSSLQMEIRPFVATDYNGVIEALRSRKLDIALLGPFSYVLAASVANVEAFALPETAKQGASYRSIIIARKDRNIRSLQDLEGKTFAFVDPSSTSGHLFPKAGMIKAGLDPDKMFSRMIFSGGHDASAIAVQNGKVDAAAIADALLDLAYKRGLAKPEDVMVVWTSQPIPGAPFAYRRDLPEDLKAKLRAAFAQMRDLPWGPANTIKRWEPTSDAAYDVVRDTAKLLNLDLKKLK